MSVEKKGFINNYYTTGNGTKLTREELTKKILDLIDKNGHMTCGNIARTLKLTNQAIYNCTAHLLRDDILVRRRDKQNIYTYSKVEQCLLSDLFYPRPEDVEKQFKIKGKKTRTVNQGSSKGSGTKGVVYNGSYYDSVEVG
jgi:predicted transcriptional regulator